MRKSTDTTKLTWAGVYTQQ